MKVATKRSTALIYVRVSRLDREDRQRRKDEGTDAQLRALSPRTQIEQVKALPALRGLKVEVFEDLHRSGKNTARPGLTRLRERMQEPDVAVVAVWSMSRLGRSVRDLYDLIEEMQAAGVAFVSAKESLDTSTASGRAFFGILATLAQFERELTSERIAANWQQAAAAGRLIGAVPFGYRRADGEVTIDAPAAARVRLVFDQYATGRFSYRDLAEWLNVNGHRPPNADGHHNNGRPHATVWANDTVKGLLRNERYIGRVVYKPRRVRSAGSTEAAVAGLFPAIVEEAIWEACEAVRTRNAAHNGLTYSRTARYALTGLLHCERCGSSMHGIHSSRATASYTYYVCRSRYGSRSCSQPLAPAGDVEGEMRTWLEAIRLPEGFAEMFAAELRNGASAARTSQRAGPSVSALEGRVARLQDLYELGDVTRREYLLRRTKILADLEAARGADRPTANAKASETIATLVDDWPRMDAGQKRQVLETVFTDVRLDDGRLIAATPRAGWIPYLEGALRAKATALVGRRRRESNPR